MNANRNLVIDFRVNNKHDHYIGDVKHVQPHQKKKYATKPKKLTHTKSLFEIVNNENKGDKNE